MRKSTRTQLPGRIGGPKVLTGKLLENGITAEHHVRAVIRKVLIYRDNKKVLVISFARVEIGEIGAPDIRRAKGKSNRSMPPKISLPGEFYETANGLLGSKKRVTVSLSCCIESRKGSTRLLDVGVAPNN